MSNDTKYLIKLRGSANDVRALLGYLEKKSAEWEKWRLKHEALTPKLREKALAALINEKGVANQAEVATWGYIVGKEENLEEDLAVDLSTFANENLGNVWVSGSEGELKSIKTLYPEVQISAFFKDEYGQGNCPSPSFEKKYSKKMFDEQNGLKPAEAKKLAKEQGALNLDISELSAESAKELARHKGGQINFSDLTSLSESTAWELSKYQGELCFEIMDELSESSAKVLARHKGKLVFLALSRLSEGAACELSRHKGELELLSPPESETAAAMLANHKSLTYLSE